MSLFYQEQKLWLGSTDLSTLTVGQDEAFYVYDLAEIRSRLQTFRGAFAPMKIHVFYAMKANSNSRILSMLRDEGCGVDVVSGGEIRLALDAGFSAQNIIFSGVGKTEKELAYAIKNGVRQINVESVPELQRIARLGRQLSIQVPVALRLNPHVNPQTHPYITTGLRENKFGMDLLELPILEEIVLREAQSIKLQGLTLHIGSQMLEISAMTEAVEKILPLFAHLKSKGHPLTTFDIGGGIGVDYIHGDSNVDCALIREYGQAMKSSLGSADAEIYCEPGRFIVAPAGVLMGQVQYVKKTPYKNFLILNTGMHHLLRPSLYQAFHRILPLQQAGDNANEFEIYDVVGPICESADVIGRDRRLPKMKEGDWLAIADAGAYGFVMASHYNAHSLPREIVV